VVVDYVGLSPDEYREQLRAWYRKYYELDVVDESLERADPEDIGHIAALHCEKVFDLSVAEFVAGVVNWDRRAALRSLLAGNIESHTAVILELADEIEVLQEEPDRLQERVAELEGDVNDA